MKPPEIKDVRLINSLVNGLFPEHPPKEETTYESVRQEDIPAFTKAEISIAIRLLKSGKAPGPDEISVEGHRHSMCRTLLDTYNVCLREGVLSSRWKRARLVLDSKGKGDPTYPSAYRPLSLLDTIGKGMEAFLRSIIQNAIKQSGGGYRKASMDLERVFRRWARDDQLPRRWNGQKNEVTGRDRWCW